VPINLLHRFRYARHSLLHQQKKSIKLHFFGREWLFNADSGGVWSVWGAFFFLAAGSSKESHQTDAVVSNKMRQGGIFIQV